MCTGLEKARRLYRVIWVDLCRQPGCVSLFLHRFYICTKVRNKENIGIL